jgi:osmotically-inducible protein OsmY
MNKQRFSFNRPAKTLQRIVLLLCCFLPLTGCIATAVVAGATAGGSIIYDKRSFKTMNQDRHASQSAQSIIDYDKTLKGRSHISIATFNHILLMVGQAQTPELRDYAYKLLLDKIKSVKRIYNEVTVAGSDSFLQRTNDTWLTTKVKTAMLATKNLRSTEIKVVTESSNVYLLGLVTQQQAKLAGNVARRVPGVKRVIEVFEYAE